MSEHESPSEATMSNKHATIEALRAEVAALDRLTQALAVLWKAANAEVEHWKARALAAEADAATLSEKLAARATVRHNLDPTQ